MTDDTQYTVSEPHTNVFGRERVTVTHDETGLFTRFNLRNGRWNRGPIFQKRDGKNAMGLPKDPEIVDGFEIALRNAGY